MAGRRVVVAAVTLGLVVGGGVATAAVKAPVAVKACVDSKGYLSVATRHACAKGSKLTSISVKGATGPAGVVGPKGAIGATGATGAAGAAGLAGGAGLAGPAGLSDVYSSLTPTMVLPADQSVAYATSVTAPAGLYLVHWEGWAENYGSLDANIYCGVATSSSVSGQHFGASLRGIQLPGGHDNVFPLSSSFPLRASQPITLEVYCGNDDTGNTDPQASAVQKVIGALVTLTAVTTLHDAAGTVSY